MLISDTLRGSSSYESEGKLVFILLIGIKSSRACRRLVLGHSRMSEPKALMSKFWVNRPLAAPMKVMVIWLPLEAGPSGEDMAETMVVRRARAETVKPLIVA